MIEDVLKNKTVDSEIAYKIITRYAFLEGKINALREVIDTYENAIYTCRESIDKFEQEQLQIRNDLNDGTIESKMKEKEIEENLKREKFQKQIKEMLKQVGIKREYHD